MMFFFLPSLEFSLLLLGISGATLLVSFGGFLLRLGPGFTMVLLMAEIPFSNRFGMVFFQAL